ncbi:hypothetical protein HYV81_06460 [Candidatus Woesearchaeota archaeon]|nr:hypothetical protein [Candidatus Woesearchaeota archaeon]
MTINEQVLDKPIWFQATPAKEASPKPIESYTPRPSKTGTDISPELRRVLKSSAEISGQYGTEYRAEERRAA